MKENCLNIEGFLLSFGDSTGYNVDHDLRLQLLEGSSVGEDGLLCEQLTTDSTPRVVVEHDDRFNLGSCSFSISLWVRTTCSGSSTIISKRQDPSPQFYSLHLEYGVPVLDICGEQTYGNEEVPVNRGGWHHVVAVRDASGAYMGCSCWNRRAIYVDGKQTCAESSSRLDNVDNMARIEIGRSREHQFHGNIKMLRVIPFALTPSQINYLHRSEYYTVVRPIEKISRNLSVRNVPELIREYWKRNKAVQAEIELREIISMMNLTDSSTISELNGLDFDGDGHLDIIEFIAKILHSNQLLSQNQLLPFVFNLIDHDGDGRIDHNSAIHATRMILTHNGFHIPTENTDQIFDDADIDIENFTIEQFANIPAIVQQLFTNNILIYL